MLWAIQGGGSKIGEYFCDGIESIFRYPHVHGHEKATEHEVILEQGGRDVIKDDFGGKLPSGRPFRPDVRGCRPDVRGCRPDVRARPRLPRGRGFTRGRVFTVCRRGKNRFRADTSESARTLVCVRANVKKK
jgi:hypothetical protein